MNLHQSKLYFEDIDRALDHVVGMEALRNKSILVTGQQEQLALLWLMH